MSSVHSAKYQRLLRLLVEVRKENNLTQQVVAKRLGKPQSYVSKYESGERRLDVIEFITVSRAIEVDPAELFKQLL